MCVQVSMSTCVCVCMWRPAVTAGCFPQSFSTFIFDPGAHWFARVCWQWAHGNPLASDSLMLSRLMFCAGVEAQVLLPAALYQGASPAPCEHVKKIHICAHTGNMLWLVLLLYDWMLIQPGLVLMLQFSGLHLSGAGFACSTHSCPIPYASAFWKNTVWSDCSCRSHNLWSETTLIIISVLLVLPEKYTVHLRKFCNLGC